jgi:hypothetical protein
MRSQVFLIIVIAATILSGCRGARKQTRGVEIPPVPPQRPSSLGENWMGPTRQPDLQVSNLANSGLIVVHDLNTGRVQLNRRMWEQLNRRDQRRIRDVLQTYQNYNAPKPVTLVFDAVAMDSTVSAR